MAKAYTCTICKTDVAVKDLKTHLASHLDTTTGKVGQYSVFAVH